MTGVTVVGVRGHLVTVEAHVGREPGTSRQAVYDLLKRAGERH